MWLVIALLAIPVVLIIVALIYDGLARRRGWRVRDSGAIERDALQDRLDHEAGHGPTTGPGGAGSSSRDWYTNLHRNRPDRPDAPDRR